MRRCATLILVSASLFSPFQALEAAPLIPCAGSDLNTRYVSSVGAMGTVIYKLKVTNRGSGPCQLGGYFDVQLLKDGERADVDVSHRRPPPPKQYVMLPGDALFFRIETDDVEPPCIRPDRLRLRAPRTNAWFDIKVDGFAYCDGYVAVRAVQDE